jgi:SET domain-containing protein
MKPHDDVYVRIQPSKIHGVGVFAIRRIEKGTYIFPNDKAQIVWLKKRALKQLPRSIKRLYDDFCIIKNGGESYGSPVNFNNMTTSWYLNHSPKPNVGCDKHFDFFAMRNIKAGEELTVDYNSFNDFATSDTKVK